MVTSNSVKRMSDSGVNQLSIMVSFNAKKLRLDTPEFSSETTGEIGLEPDVSFPKEQDMLCLSSMRSSSARLKGLTYWSYCTVVGY